MRFESPPLYLLLSLRENHTQGNRVLFPGNHSVVVVMVYYLVCVYFYLLPSLPTVLVEEVMFSVAPMCVSALCVPLRLITKSSYFG